MDATGTTTTTTTKTRPLKPGQQYHLNVIYNHARCPLSTTEDTQRSLAWTQHAVTLLQRQGLASAYYHDRDCPRGRSFAQELGRVVRASERTLVVLSPGFVRDCWPRYWLLSSFRALFDSPPPASLLLPVSTFSRASSTTSNSSWSGSSPRTASGSAGDAGPSGGSEVVVVALGLRKEDLPEAVKGLEVLFFSWDWGREPGAWQGLGGALGLGPLHVRQCQDDRRELSRAESSTPSLSSSRSAAGSSLHRQDTPRGASPRSQSTTSSGDIRRQSSKDTRTSRTSTIEVDGRDEVGNPENDKDRVRNENDFLDGAGKREDVSQEREDKRSGKVQQRQRPGVTPGGDLESAVLDRLGNAGIKRESLGDASITRVFVHGNTVTIDTLRTDDPPELREQPPPPGGGGGDTTPAESGSTEGVLSTDSRSKKERGVLATTDTEIHSAIIFSHGKDQESLRGAMDSVDSGLSSGAETVSTPSPRRKLHYSEEYDSPSDSSSYSISLTTQNCERSAAGSPRPAKREGVLTPRMTARTEVHDEESCRTHHQGEARASLGTSANDSSQRSAPSYRVYSSNRKDKASSPRKELAGSANSAVLNQRASAGVDSCEYDHIVQDTRQHSPQSVYQKDRLATENHRKDLETSSTANSSKSREGNQRHQHNKNLRLPVSRSQSPRKDCVQASGRFQKQTTKQEVVEETITKQTMEETMSQTTNFVSSIEDEHDVTMDSFSGSWSTSDYGTMSPRVDLSSSLCGDSGFLSGDLSSLNSSTRANDPTSKNPDHQRPSETGRDASISDQRFSSTLVTTNALKERTERETELLEKRSATTTSFHYNKTLSQNNNNSSQAQDSLDGPPENCFPHAVSLERSSKLTIEKGPQNPDGIFSKETVTSVPGHGVLKESSGQREVREEMTKTDWMKVASARASRSSLANIRHALTRKDSWIYIDVDKDWNFYAMLLPLYHVMCYALSRPEMPYF